MLTHRSASRTSLAGPLPRRALAVLAAVTVVAGCPTSRGDGGEVVGDGTATVTRVVDGDTLAVEVDGTHERVRLIGIDTPESVAEDRPVQCYGHEASDRMAELAPPGTVVRLERDVEARDRYDRLLAYVHRDSDDLFLNLAMVDEGFADASRYPPNLAHQDELDAAEADARAQSRGLWGACGGPDVPIAPPPEG